MATWIAHMRVAEYFMLKHEELNNARFLVGNIGPDCGVPNDDWSIFTPNKNITHWSTDSNGGSINAADFKDKYLQIKDERYPFYLGYYFHLLTDIAWSKLYEQKDYKLLYAEKFNVDKNFIWTIKEDWYGQDHLFLQTNKDFVFYNVFSKINEFPNEYFDFYPDNAFIRQIKYITQFYLNANENAEREFPYLSKQEMDSFVIETIESIERTCF